MPPDHQPVDWQALDRYLAGEGSREEREAMRRQIQANPVLAALVEAMRSVHGAASESPPPRSDVNASWQALASRLGFESPAQRGRPRATLSLISSPPRNRLTIGKSIGLAAAALIVAGASLLSWRAWRGAARARDSAPALRAEYHTARGERATIELHDGTRVILAPETDLRIGAVGRQVYIRGEAVFNVAHDATHPFRVIAPNGMIVQDIGTQFDLRAYDRLVRVVVAEGSVLLRGSAQPVTLISGSVATIDSAGATAVVHSVAVDRYLEWTAGRLTFTNARMADVLPELNRWLDVDVRLGSPALADERLTLTLTDVPADVTLDIIARALDARVVRSGQSVTLYPRTSREDVRE